MSGLHRALLTACLILPATALRLAAVTCGPDGPCRLGGCYAFNVIADFSFEDNLCSNWQFAGGADRAYSANLCNYANYHGLLDESDRTTHTIYQDVILPSNPVSAQLAFSLDVLDDNPPGYGHDTLTIEIRDPSDDSLLQTLGTISTAAASSYQCGSASYNLSGSLVTQNRPLRVVFRATWNDLGVSKFRIDGVYLWAECGTATACTFPP